MKFLCSPRLVEELIRMFDGIISTNNMALERLLRGSEVTIRKDYNGGSQFESRGIAFSNSNINLDRLTGMDISLIRGRSKLKNISEVGFNPAYFYKIGDVLRVSKDRGIAGTYVDYMNSEIIYQPTSVFNFSKICEVRGRFRELLGIDYRVEELKNSKLLALKDDRAYKNYMRSCIISGESVNRILDKGGVVFCGNGESGYRALDDLLGIENAFYTELLEGIVELGINVHTAYFYSDLNWSRVLIRESREVSGEYDIVLK